MTSPNIGKSAKFLSKICSKRFKVNDSVKKTKQAPSAGYGINLIELAMNLDLIDRTSLLRFPSWYPFNLLEVFNCSNFNI